MSRPVSKVVTSKGIRKVVEDEQLEEIWFDTNSRGHHLHRCKLETGAIILAYPLENHKTSYFVPQSFKGVNYDGKVQTVSGKYTLEIDLENIELTRDIQVVFLTGQVVWKKDGNKIIGENASLQAIKKYINLTAGKCTITNPKYPNSEYVCTRDTYDRETLHMYIH
jgi:hypothetical protein